MMSHELIVTRMKACDDEETCFFWYYRFCSKVSLGPRAIFFALVTGQLTTDTQDVILLCMTYTYTNVD
ncbi:hypothetical protein HanRHA438_Chr12g0537871 [Helianthus annuus]|nr:hypothetical protein HanRHA438_Chr12g0537871 [Helianthus annuus]